MTSYHPGLIILAIFSLGVAGGVIGLTLRASLSRLQYRIIGPRDDERDLPHPGPRWWLPPILGLAWFALAVAYGHTGWPWLFLWLPFATAGMWLTAVDLDVKRLPDKVLGWVALHSLVVGLVLILMGYATWLPALVGALGAGGLFWLLHLMSRGGLGFGDVKYVTICGWNLGLLGWEPIFWGLLVACFCAIIWAIATRRWQFAFGPWLSLGTVTAASLAGFAQAGAF
ncbi:MAG: A24 family peptidase [Propionibacteriaceae bacterium]|jgi:leader peptidase (prepilin peptidase)/N-methyltransferase|nr:A24 family peptidase [Propionibacteriaceae bacterium]